MITAGVQCADCQNKRRSVRSTYELFQAIKQEYADAVKSGKVTIQKCPVCPYRTVSPTRLEIHVKAHKVRGEMQ